MFSKQGPRAPSSPQANHLDDDDGDDDDDDDVGDHDHLLTLDLTQWLCW